MFKKYVKRLIKWVGVPSALISTALILTTVFFFNSDINPNVLSANHSNNSIQNKRGVISGKFTAQENFLGIVTIRFNNKESPIGNSVFKIKNILDDGWYHEATIAASQYYTVPQYAFGIPVIAKSKNQTYLFEIRHLDNTPDGRSLILSSKYPVLISQYSFPKSIFIENKSLLFEFIYKKISYFMLDEASWKVLLVYSIPLVLYLLFLIFESKLQTFRFVIKAREKLTSIFKPYLLFLFLYIFIDVFIIRKYSESVITLFIFLWILEVSANRLESRYSFALAFVLFMFCPFLLSVNIDWVAEKSALWAYMFLVMGTVHALIELRTEQSPRMSAFFNTISMTTSHAVTRFKTNRLTNYSSDIIRSALSVISYVDCFLIALAKKIMGVAFSSLRNFIKIITIFIICSIILIMGFDLYLIAKSNYERLMKNPGQPVIEPMLVYAGTKVILYGERFGDQSNNKFALMRDGVRIRTDHWDDHKIIFTVPLDWKKPGEMKIWIEKPVEWNAETVIERTRPVVIKLLLVTDHFTSDDDLYFEQLKTWRKETKELNGYE